MNDHQLTTRPGPKLGSDHLGACAWIIKRRKALGMSQRTLCRLADVPRSSLGHYEAGDHSPTLPVLVRLAEAMGYDLVLRGSVSEVSDSGHPYLVPPHV